jgi:hypothetical protein
VTLTRIIQCAVNCGDFQWEIDPPGNWIAPAGSSRSGEQEVNRRSIPMSKGRLGGSASVQAVTRVNAEQASKRVMRRPTRLNNGEGCHHGVQRS